MAKGGRMWCSRYINQQFSSCCCVPNFRLVRAVHIAVEMALCALVTHQLHVCSQKKDLTCTHTTILRYVHVCLVYWCDVESSACFILHVARVSCLTCRHAISTWEMDHSPYTGGVLLAVFHLSRGMQTQDTRKVGFVP